MSVPYGYGSGYFSWDGEETKFQTIDAKTNQLIQGNQENTGTWTEWGGTDYPDVGVTLGNGNYGINISSSRWKRFQKKLLFYKPDAEYHTDVMDGPGTTEFPAMMVSMNDWKGELYVCSGGYVYNSNGYKLCKNINDEYVSKFIDTRRGFYAYANTITHGLRNRLCWGVDDLPTKLKIVYPLFEGDDDLDFQGLGCFYDGYVGDVIYDSDYSGISSVTTDQLVYLYAVGTSTGHPSEEAWEYGWFAEYDKRYLLKSQIETLYPDKPYYAYSYPNFGGTWHDTNPKITDITFESGYSYPIVAYRRNFYDYDFAKNYTYYDKMLLDGRYNYNSTTDEGYWCEKWSDDNLWDYGFNSYRIFNNASELEDFRTVYNYGGTAVNWSERVDDFYFYATPTGAKYQNCYLKCGDGVQDYNIHGTIDWRISTTNYMPLPPLSTSTSATFTIQDPDEDTVKADLRKVSEIYGYPYTLKITQNGVTTTKTIYNVTTDPTLFQIELSTEYPTYVEVSATKLTDKCYIKVHDNLLQFATIYKNGTKIGDVIGDNWNTPRSYFYHLCDVGDTIEVRYGLMSGWSVPTAGIPLLNGWYSGPYGTGIKYSDENCYSFTATNDTIEIWAWGNDWVTSGFGSFDWDYPKTQGQYVKVTADEWNRLWNVMEMQFNGGDRYQHTYVTPGMPITASIMNEVITVLNLVASNVGEGQFHALVTQGSPLYASLFADIKTFINSHVPN